MACGTYPDNPIRYFLDWRFMDGAVCTFGDQMGVSVTMLAFFGITFLVLYQSSDSILLTAGVLIVLAPVTMALLPVVGVRIAGLMVIISIGAIGMYAYMSAS